MRNRQPAPSALVGLELCPSHQKHARYCGVKDRMGELMSAEDSIITTGPGDHEPGRAYYPIIAHSEKSTYIYICR